MRNVEQEAAVERRERRVGEWIGQVEQGAGLGELEGGRLTGLTVRLPTEADPGVLIVVKAVDEVERHVAFVGAYKLGDALLAWRARSGKGRMKWREDRPWAGTAG